MYKIQTPVSRFKSLLFSMEALEMDSFQVKIARRINEQREQTMRAAADKWLYLGISRLASADEWTRDAMCMLMQSSGIVFVRVIPSTHDRMFLEVRRGSEVLEVVAF